MPVCCCRCQPNGEQEPAGLVSSTRSAQCVESSALVYLRLALESRKGCSGSGVLEIAPIEAQLSNRVVDRSRLEVATSPIR